ncbi:MAG: RecX family transcriptional regulator [Candidatus Gracilibacteria bacterium]|nr:RecX family transcriptional regulator [Candidatus Gracilibacteria bacterium]
MDFNYLRNYAINYYLRYYPSSKKLEEKLILKANGDNNLVNKVLDSLKSLVVDNTVIEMKIRYYIGKNKKLSYIKSKLYEKGFNKEDYEKILSEKFNLEESFFDKDYLQRKVEDYKAKGKSKKYIFSKLYERKCDKELIEFVIDNVFGVDGEIESVMNDYNKLKLKFDDKKIYEKLLRKGYSYEIVKKVLNK